MYPSPLIFTSKNSVRVSIAGKPFQEKNFEDISEKELLCRLVALSQGLHSMVLFFVLIAIIEIVIGIVILAKLL